MNALMPGQQYAGGGQAADNCQVTYAATNGIRPYFVWIFSGFVSFRSSWGKRFVLQRKWQSVQRV